MPRSLAALLLLALLAGCASSTPFHNLNLGMSKPEALQVLGKPTDVNGAGSEEYLWYTPLNKFWKKYYVRLVNGRVDSYGPLGPEKRP